MGYEKNTLMNARPLNTTIRTIEGEWQSCLLAKDIYIIYSQYKYLSVSVSVYMLPPEWIEIVNIHFLNYKKNKEESSIGAI